VCSVYHGGLKLSIDISSDAKEMSTEGFPGTVIWDNWYIMLLEVRFSICIAHSFLDLHLYSSMLTEDLELFVIRQQCSSSCLSSPSDISSMLKELITLFNEIGIV